MLHLKRSVHTLYSLIKIKVFHFSQIIKLRVKIHEYDDVKELPKALVTQQPSAPSKSFINEF